MFWETPFVLGTTPEAVLSILQDVHMCVCLSENRFSAPQLWCKAEIKITAKFKYRCGLTHEY